MKYTKTTKSVTDFYPTIAYQNTRMDNVIYQGDDKTYFQVHDYNLGIAKNSLASSRWFTITSEFASRPDKLAYAMYGDENLYWIILSHNNLTDPFDMEVGLVIEIPAISEVQTKIKEKRDKIKLK